MSESKIHIVLIEDEKQIRRFLSAALEAEGMQVYESETGKQGLITCATRKPDLLIVDLGLPDMDGIAVIRDVRSWSDVPIIVLSARTLEQEKVAALDAGADDYLSKPFGAAELIARIRAHMRRRQPLNALADANFIFGDIVIDFSLRSVTRAGLAVHLSPLEYRLLCVLARNAGKVLTHRQLLKEVWGPNHSESSHYLRIYMANLRQKLEQQPAQPKYFLTETGVGYRLITQ
ncbi:MULTISPECIES: two-component system response regulator KdpE [unclassified Undibacterium]|uniref:two-component system response regulator KdpE n=2 Tax=Pseudomonadota TaxID=1224 RepID=UPI002AC8C869|nr:MULTISPECIES: two-component system response regulator KdpE [unclassified Undibacterium]MEB0139907.1 two-component system response regulator KdpE [Undibacterium sp. CCC2.1]MEB0171824.1 two-component system response regulator KdpE [Undibacterium sp. CCC1.1]MEB0175640.1 two-component system response regulator KdpE [Undibacterium sp. CCC3.4]MEB0216222.1 two-component system response regulator KdpE [Undibacterium sp. 5I2]WPX44115.1 two-component system response regulator KdpE [Undibacterium sp. 